MAQNYYEILGVSIHATSEELRKARNELAKQFHPDKLGNRSAGEEVEMKAVTEAYAVLSDINKRNQYDLTLPQQQARTQTTDPYKMIIYPDSEITRKRA